MHLRERRLCETCHEKVDMRLRERRLCERVESCHETVVARLRVRIVECSPLDRVYTVCVHKKNNVDLNEPLSYYKGLFYYRYIMRLEVNHLIQEYASTHIWITFLWLLFTIVLYPIQHVIIPKYYGLVINSFKDQSSKFFQLVAYLVGFYIATMVLDIALLYCSKEIGPSFGEFATARMFNYVLDNYELDFDNIRSGEILARLPCISPIFMNYLFTIRMLLFSQVFVALTALYHYYYISLDVFFFFLFAIALNMLYIYNVFLIKHKIELSWYKRRSSLFEYINDTVLNLVSIYSANREEEEKKLFLKEYKPLMEDEIKDLDVVLVSNIIWNVLCVVIFLTLNYLIYKAYLNKKINVETLVSTFTLTFSVLRFYEIAPFVIKELSRLLSEIGDIDGYFKSIENKYVKTHGGFENGVIEYKNVYHKYKDDFVLSGASFKINQGEKIALVGHIGSGKSTAIKLLLGFLPLTMGDITIRGVSIRHISNQELRKHIFYIPQKPKLFNRTLYENITYGIEGVGREKIIALLRDLKLDDVAETFAEKMDQTSGLDGSHLSGGQKQIVWLLRSFFGKSKIVVMDEPLASLDAKNKDLMLKNILKLCIGKTLIMISHDMIDLQFRKIEFMNGKIVDSHWTGLNI